jgi:hypothetical protein
VIQLELVLSGTTFHATAWAFLAPLFLLMLAGYAFSGGLCLERRDHRVCAHHTIS